MSGIVKITTLSLITLVLVLMSSLESHAAVSSPDSLVYSFHFRLSDDLLMKDYRENKRNFEAMERWMTAENIARISNIKIAGTASPEGVLEFNNLLSLKRAEAVRKYILYRWKTINKQTVVANRQTDYLSAWVLAIQNDPSVPRREKVLEILNSNASIQTKWANIQLLTGKASQYIRKYIFPQLRNSVACIGNATKGSLMLMPQPIVAGTFQFEVTYDVYNLQGVLMGSKVIKTADMAALEMGKKYAYTLILPASENDKISFDVAVTDWDDASVATEREVRFDEYTLNGTSDAGDLADLITGYVPTVIYLQEVMVAGEINAATAIDLTRLSATATAGSKIILDCSAVTNLSATNKVSVTNVPSTWSANVSELSTAGKITITKN